MNAKSEFTGKNHPTPKGLLFYRVCRINTWNGSDLGTQSQNLNLFEVLIGYGDTDKVNHPTFRVCLAQTLSLYSRGAAERLGSIYLRGVRNRPF